MFDQYPFLYLIIFILYTNFQITPTAGDDDREYIHIKVHLPDIVQKHTHLRTIVKHHFHPKKLINPHKGYSHFDSLGGLNLEPDFIPPIKSSVVLHPDTTLNPLIYQNSWKYDNDMIGSSASEFKILPQWDTQIKSNNLATKIEDFHWKHRPIHVEPINYKYKKSEEISEEDSSILENNEQTAIKPYWPYLKFSDINMDLAHWTDTHGPTMTEDTYQNKLKSFNNFDEFAKKPRFKFTRASNRPIRKTNASRYTMPKNHLKNKRKNLRFNYDKKSQFNL